MTRARRYRIPLLAVQLSTLLVAHTAVADPDPNAVVTADPNAVVAVDTTGTTTATTTTAAAIPPSTTPIESTTATAEPVVAAARYPRAVIARPLTFPEGVLGFGADATSNKDGSTMFGSPIAGYGFTDKAELQVGYSFATNSFEPKGALAADFGYAVIRGAVDGKLEAIARVRTGYDALNSVATPLMVGLHVQYNVTPKICVISGSPGNQQIAVSAADNADGAKPSFLQLPVAVGVQPTELFYLQLDTKLGRINFHDSTNALFGRDETPLALTAVYNVMNALDVQAAVGADMSADKIGDSFSVLVGARYYAGDL